MSNLKKLFFSFMVFVLVLTSIIYCFAESGETVIIGSDEDLSDMNFIESDEDYEKLLSEIQGTNDYSTSDTDDEELKEYYEQYQEYIKDYYNSYERPQVNSAKVIEAGESKEKYEIVDYYSVGKYLVQTIKVEILDGEHKGAQISLDYIRTGDSMDNIHFAPLKVGDRIFVLVEEGNSGELTATITNTWAFVSRSGMVIVFTVIAFLLLIIYGGKKGINTGLISALAIIFSIVIITSFAYLGLGVIGIGVLFILCLILTISMAYLGLTKSTLKANGVSIVMTFFAFVLVWFMSLVTRTAGVTFETAAVAENIILHNINFEHLYYIITLSIASAFITNATCSAIRRIERESSEEFEEKIYVCKDVIISNVVLCVVTMIVLYIPNHLLLVNNKFDMTEQLNSETFISEAIRIISIVICIIMTVPCVSVPCLKIGRKYLSEGKKENN